MRSCDCSSCGLLRSSCACSGGELALRQSCPCLTCEMAVAHSLQAGTATRPRGPAHIALLFLRLIYPGSAAAREWLLCGNSRPSWFDDSSITLAAGAVSWVALPRCSPQNRWEGGYTYTYETAPSVCASLAYSGAFARATHTDANAATCAQLCVDLPSCQSWTLECSWGAHSHGTSTYDLCCLHTASSAVHRDWADACNVAGLRAPPAILGGKPPELELELARMHCGKTLAAPPDHRLLLELDLNSTVRIAVHDGLSESAPLLAVTPTLRSDPVGQLLPMGDGRLESSGRYIFVQVVDDSFTESKCIADGWRSRVHVLPPPPDRPAVPTNAASSTELYEGVKWALMLSRFACCPSR